METLLIQAPNQSVRVGDSRYLSQLLSQKLKPTQDDNALGKFYEKIKYFLLDNWQRVWVMVLWVSILVGLFTYKFIQYRHKAAFKVMTYCVCIAKGGAETLKFNMALILLPVCRNTITWLRNKTKLGVAVPFDDNLNFHKVRMMDVISFLCQDFKDYGSRKFTKRKFLVQFCQCNIHTYSECSAIGDCSWNRHWSISSCRSSLNM